MCFVRSPLPATCRLSSSRGALQPLSPRSVPQQGTSSSATFVQSTGDQFAVELGWFPSTPWYPTTTSREGSIPPSGSARVPQSVVRIPESSPINHNWRSMFRNHPDFVPWERAISVSSDDEGSSSETSGMGVRTPLVTPRTIRPPPRVRSFMFLDDLLVLTSFGWFLGIGSSERASGSSPWPEDSGSWFYPFSSLSEAVGASPFSAADFSLPAAGPYSSPTSSS